MNDVLVRAKGLRREFGNGQRPVVAVADATFEICAGDRIALGRAVRQRQDVPCCT